jgi:hypothetical protein
MPARLITGSAGPAVHYTAVDTLDSPVSQQLVWDRYVKHNLPVKIRGCVIRACVCACVCVCVRARARASGVQAGLPHTHLASETKLPTHHQAVDGHCRVIRPLALVEHGFACCSPVVTE